MENLCNDFKLDRYKCIIDNMVDGFAYQQIIFDENNNPTTYKYIDINPSFEAIIGLKKEEVINKTLIEVFPNIHETNFDWVDAGIRAALHGETIKCDIYAAPVNKWLSCSIFSYEYGYFAVIFHDITDVKFAERKVKDSEQKYKSVFSAVLDAMFVIDAETGEIISANPAACKLYGYTMNEILKLNRVDLVKDKRVLARNIEKGNKKVLVHNKRKDGTDFPVSITISELTYKGRLLNIAAVRDLTEHSLLETLKKDLEKNLLLLNESKIYEQLRTEFFANISHELRTPLNVILGTLQLINLYLNDGEAIDKFKLNRYSKIMKQNCLRLLRLVNNLIDITKLDSGYMKPSLENKNIISVVEDITLSVADYIENRSVSLTFDTEVEERIMAVDPDIIERIVLNLLSNAIKFTRPNSSIFVNLYENNSTFFISVKDTGIGIPEEKLNIIFDRFRQVDQSLTRSSEGSGIGLSLVKSLVELLEGKIHVKSSLGIGSEFTIELPIKVLPDKPALLTKEVNMNQSHVDRINIEFSDVYSCV